MSSSLSRELEYNYATLMPRHPAPWRVEAVGDGEIREYEVRDSRGRPILTTWNSSLATLISLIPDICDGDIRGRVYDDEKRKSFGNRVTADVSRR